MTVVCLGWGSLIWNSGSLPVRGSWKDDGPGVQVEFARQSVDGRLTLVMTESGPVSSSLWAELNVADLSAGAEALRRREGTASRFIGVWPAAGAPAAIDAWASARDFVGVVWTALPPKFGTIDGHVATAAEALTYLRSLTGETRSRAREYFVRAPGQIRTPIRDLVESELGWRPESSTS